MGSFPSGGMATGAEGKQYESFAAAAIGTDSDATHKLGEGFSLPDGRTFRFGKNAASVAGVANNLAQASVPSSDFDTLAVAVAAAVGDTSIQFTNGSTAIIHGDLDEGFVLAEDTAGLGHIYKIRNIRGDTAGATQANVGNVSAAATGTLNLYPGASVIAALSTSRAVTLIFSPYFETVIAASPITSRVVGIPQIALAVGAYGWYATGGMSSCLVNGVHVLGEPLVPSNAIDGATAMKRVRGTATITTTSVVITHNSGNTPILGDINVEYGEDPTTAPATRWIDTFTTTQFTINVEVDPSTNDLDLAWVLEVPADPIGVCAEVAPTTDFGAVFLTLE